MSILNKASSFCQWPQQESGSLVKGFSRNVYQGNVTFIEKTANPYVVRLELGTDVSKVMFFPTLRYNWSMTLSNKVYCCHNLSQVKYILSICDTSLHEHRCVLGKACSSIL